MGNGVNWSIGYDLKKEDIPEAFWEEVEKALNTCLLFQIKLKNLDTNEVAKEASELIDKEAGTIRFGEKHTLSTSEPEGFRFIMYGQKTPYELNCFCKSGFFTYDVAIQCVCIIAEKHGVVKDPRTMKGDPEYIYPWMYEEFGNPFDDEYFEYARAEGILRVLGIIGKEDHYDKWRKEYHEDWLKRHEREIKAGIRRLW